MDEMGLGQHFYGESQSPKKKGLKSPDHLEIDKVKKEANCNLKYRQSFATFLHQMCGKQPKKLEAQVQG